MGVEGVAVVFRLAALFTMKKDVWKQEEMFSNKMIFR